MKTEKIPKIKYRCISFLLSLLFMLGLFLIVPVPSVYAAEAGDEAALSDLVSKGGDITLSDDISIRECLKIPAGVSVTLDLNGKTLDRGLAIRKQRSNLISVDPNEKKTDENSDTTECTELGSVIIVEAGAELTIKDSSGNNSGVISGGASYKGGGILNHGTLTFEGGTIKGNKALNENEGLGGGICSIRENSSSATLIINGGVIKGNEADSGGGIFIGEGSFCSITGCKILNNTANGQGGGVSVSDSAVCDVSDSMISDNYSYGTGGGIYLSQDGQLNLKDSTLSENICREDGGALWIGNSQNTKVKLKKCEIKENVSSYCGGGIYTQGEGELVIDECSLISNTVSSGTGGALHAEKEGLKLVLIDTDISGNWTYDKGAVCAKGCVISMKGLVTIESNTSKNSRSQANLYLSDDSFIGNPGLYQGSKIMISGAQKLFAKEISEYQSRYFVFETGKADFQEEKTVDTPLVASLFGNGGVIMAISLAALGIVVMIIALIIKKKKTAKGAADHEYQ